MFFVLNFYISLYFRRPSTDTAASGFNFLKISEQIDFINGQDMQMLGDQVTQNPVVVGDIYIHLYCGQYALMSRQDLGLGSSPWT